MNISDRLKEIRNYYDVSQKDFAKALNSTQSVLSAIETERKDISRTIIVNLKSAYSDININWLITGEGSMILSPPTPGERLAYFRHDREIRPR